MAKSQERVGQSSPMIGDTDTDDSDGYFIDLAVLQN